MKPALMLLAATMQLSAVQAAAELQVITPLSFGSLLVHPSGGAISLTASGSLLPEGPGVAPAMGAVPAHARLRLRGPAHARFTLRLDPANPVLAGSAGGAIRVAGFLPPPEGLAGSFDASGSRELVLGARLAIPWGIPAGSYGGTVNLLLNVENCPSVVQPLSLYCAVRSPLTLVTLANLDFGTILAGDGGIFRLNPTRGHTAGGRGPRLMRGTPHPAAFRLTGPANTPYSILLPAEATLAGPGATIRVIDFTSDQQQGRLPGNGLTFHVGAGLEIRADQPAGTYRGIFQVLVAYP